jgi:poly-beta-1,6-N-acetyl-D-glucosamine synthase
VKRRKRINAGRYQAIAMAGQLLPLSHPVLLWQILSHKFLRPLIPFFMLSAALLNILAVAMPPANHSLWSLGRPWSLYILTLQVLFYGLALLGSRFTGGRKSRLSRLLYLPTFLVNSNLAAVQGLFMYLRGGKIHMWERIQRG